MVQRVPVASVSSAARRGARSRGASGCGRNSITGGAKRTRCTEWSRCACSIASRRSATSAVTSRKLASRGAGGSAQPARPAPPPATARAPPPEGGGADAPARLRGRRRTQPPHQVARRRQVGDVAQPDQHHLGGGAAVGRGLHLADALQQHLPGARQHRHRQPIGQRRAAGALGLRQFLAVAQRRDRFQPGDRVHQLQQILQHHAEIGAALVRRSVICSAWRGLAGHHRLHAGRTPGRGPPGPACRRPPPR